MDELAEKLLSLRDQIDTIDDNIARLLNERAAIAKRVGNIKSQSTEVFYSPNREHQILERIGKENQGGDFPAPSLHTVFQEIIAACLRLQARVSVSFLGPPATFTHLAVRKQFGSAAATQPNNTIRGVFQDVMNGRADFGVVPVENSTEGVVGNTLDCLIDCSVEICAETSIPVHHCLLAKEPQSLQDIQRVYSHPQALAQTRKWRAENIPHAAEVPCLSTVDAALRAVADKGSAAIASTLARATYHLTEIAANIQDQSHNETRFVTLCRKDSNPASFVVGKPYKTTLMIELGHQPGDLVTALAPLSSSGINLTKIQSRPKPNRKWHYVFFVDIEGHPAQSVVANAISATQQICNVTILGSYRKASSP